MSVSENVEYGLRVKKVGRAELRTRAAVARRIFQIMFRPNQAPVVNVVAAVLVIASRLAQRLSGSAETMAS